MSERKQPNLKELKERYEKWSNEHYLDRDDSICHELMDYVDNKVLPGRTDTERLDFIIKRGVIVTQYGGKFLLASDSWRQKNTFNTPREAIDASMDEEQKA